MAELRRRVASSAVAPMMTGSDSHHEREAYQHRSHYDVGLSALKMLRSSPQHFGYVSQLHAPALFLLLPFFLQRLLLKSWLRSWLAPSWEKRYLVILGSYVYRFDDERSATLRGAPLQLTSLEVDLVSPDSVAVQDHNISVALEHAPGDGNAVFAVANGYKKYYFAVSTVETARLWVTSIRQARQEAITRSMGHAASDSYPPSWESFDRLGDLEMRRKENLRRRLREISQSELEMSGLNDGGPLPRGYYG